MATVVFLTFPLLFCNAQSQLFGSGPQYPIPQGLNTPGPGSSNTGSNTLDIIAPSGPINIISNQNTPNSKTVLNSAQNYGPSSQTVIPYSNPNLQNPQFLNIAPSVIQNTQPSFINSYPINQIPLINLQNPTINQIPSDINVPSCSINQLPLINLPNPTFNQIPSAINVPPCSINQYPNAINLPNAINPTCFNPVQPQSIICTSPPAIPNIPQIAPSLSGNFVPTCNSQPGVITVIDNTLANSLANALLLLIVSNLIENNLGSGICSTNCGTANFLPSGPCDFEIVTPDFTAPITYEVPVVSYECPVVSCPDSVCSIPDPVCTIPDPVCTIPEPVCLIPEPVCTIPEPVCFIPDQSYSIPDFIYTISEPVYQTQTPCIDYTNSIPTFSVIDSSCQNYVPFAYDAPSSCVPQFMPSNIPCDMPAVASIPPMALEIPFPSSIPAQLICNFGYLPSNQPCVSFDVEPLPYGNMPFFGTCGL